MMDIIVCGAIPPYNELLGGKLVSILACSPQVISDYTNRYKKQVSEIASRMKGKKVIRDSRLAYMGTTSLYAIGSSQYNRIKVPIAEDFELVYKKGLELLKGSEQFIFLSIQLIYYQGF